MKSFLKTTWPILVCGVVLMLFCGLAISGTISSNRRIRETTVTSGALLGDLPVEQVTIRTYSVTRTVYLDAVGQEVFRTERAYEIKE